MEDEKLKYTDAGDIDTPALDRWLEGPNSRGVRTWRTPSVATPGERNTAWVASACVFQRGHSAIVFQGGQAQTKCGALKALDDGIATEARAIVEASS